MHMSDRGVENVFLRLRWPQTDGKPVCPRWGGQICYDCRRSDHQPRWRWKACRADFSITSGTLFAWHKLPLRSYLMAATKEAWNCGISRLGIDAASRSASSVGSFGPGASVLKICTAGNKDSMRVTIVGLR
jgi:hypothetical protein